MSKASSNPCTRCGKERVEARSWTESIDTYYGKSEITYTETVCPDPDCQEVVEKKLEEQRERTKNILLEREERSIKNKAARRG